MTASKYPLPTLLSVRPGKLATPLVAETVSVPPSVLLPGLLASATVSLPVKPVATLPSASSAVTVKPNPLPVVMVVGGWPVISNCVAAAGVTVTGPLVPAIVAVGSVAVIVCEPAVSSVAVAVATPLVNENVENVLPPRLSASVTESLNPVTTLL